MLQHILYVHYYYEEIFENIQMKIDIVLQEVTVHVDYYTQMTLMHLMLLIVQVYLLIASM